VAYLRQYAHELAKRPEDLAPEEHEWVRRHYRDPHFNHALWNHSFRIWF
jgi:hypothetical protein